MTQVEFTNRTQVEVTIKEFDAINEVYMNSEVDKDVFCKMWCKMNAKRVAKAKADKKQAEEEAEKKMEAANIYWTLLYNMHYEVQQRLYGREVLNYKERALVESFDVDVENSLVCNMLYNLSIKIGINK